MPIDHNRLNEFGGKIVNTDKYSDIVTFSSVKIDQGVLTFIQEQDSIHSLLFYYCDFSCADFSILVNSQIKVVSVMHGNFSEKHLCQLIAVNALEKLKVFDTDVTKDQLNRFKEKRNNIEVL